MTPGLLKPVGRWARRVLRATAGFLLLYLLFLVVGLIPINRGFVPPTAGTDVYIVSTSVHADLIVPRRHARWDWDERFPADHFTGRTGWATHFAIGWGDRGFYLETPTWSDLKASTAARAMFLPSGAVLHVACSLPPAAGPSVCRVRLDDDQYERLCRSIARSLDPAAPGGAARPITGAGFGDHDAFYEARGVYHCFNTCNSWAGRRLADAGLPVPLFAPLPGEPMLYLPDAPVAAPAGP